MNGQVVTVERPDTPETMEDGSGALTPAALSSPPSGREGDATGPEIIGYREVLADRNFRRLWQAQLWAGAGTALAQVAMPLLVYDLTGSERLVGVIAVCQTVPRVLLSPVAGVLLDRIDRRKLMLAADVERALLVALLPFTAAVWQIGIIAALVGIGNAIGGPAEMAAVPAVAGKRRLLPALSLAQVTGSVIRVIVPAAGAAAITAASAVGFALVGWLTPMLTPEWTLALAGLLVGLGGPLVLHATGALTVMRRGTVGAGAGA